MVGIEWLDRAWDEPLFWAAAFVLSVLNVLPLASHFRKDRN